MKTTPLRRGLLAAVLAVASITASKAATLTFSSSAPTGGASSISNWTGATFDADNIGGTGVNSNGSPNNGSANDGTTYIANNRPAQGQTFTTGSNTGGYTLSAITVRMQGYTNNTASGSNIGGYSLASTSSTFRIRVGTLSGTTFIPLTIETATSGGTGTPGTGSAANGPGTYLTFTLKAPIVLQPNTTYAFDLGTSSDYFEMLGIRDGATGGNPYTAGTAYTSGASGVASGTVTTQTGDRVFQVSLTTYTPPTAGTFVHPGLLNTEADFTKMRTNVALGVSPWAAGYTALTSNWMGSQSGGWSPNAQATITRSGSTNNTSLLYNDIAVCYGSALRWKISGDTAYADQAVTILNAWGSTLTSVAGDTNVLLTELYGYQFCCAAEIMRTYSGWQAADISTFQTMMYNVFYPLADNFLTGHFGTGNTHYWANWDLAALNTMYAIGVLDDNTSLTTEATNYFYSGIGNGCIDRMVNYIHPGYLGQGQEIGRDQGHATLDIAELATLCQMAWNQGVDFYGYENNKVLAVAEYTAQYQPREHGPLRPLCEQRRLADDRTKLPIAGGQLASRLGHDLQPLCECKRAGGPEYHDRV
ncbi:MAG: alginate lyase family protein [Chthoniobacteraceae bacterium]